MTNTDTIPPALTAEEWDAIRESGGAAEAWPHKTMALANASLPNDDPRKITREDVGYLRRSADPYDKTDPLSVLAAKLAALLPPE